MWSLPYCFWKWHDSYYTFNPGDYCLQTCHSHFKDMENQAGIPGCTVNRAQAKKWAHLDIVSFLRWGYKALHLGCDMWKKCKGGVNHLHSPSSPLSCDELAQKYTAPLLSGGFLGALKQPAAAGSLWPSLWKLE